VSKTFCSFIFSPTNDFSSHEHRVHCIWDEFRCDGHQVGI